LVKGDDVSDGELGFLTTVYELSGCDTLSCNEPLGHTSVSVWVTELNVGDGSSSTRVVSNLGDCSLQKPPSFAIVKRPQPRRSLSLLDMSLVHGTTSVPLRSDDLAHISL
jgi:hypothetical protein